MKEDTKQLTKNPPSLKGWVLGTAFLALAGWLYFGPPLSVVPSTAARSFPPDALSTAPRRTIVGDPPRILINNFERSCTDCHSIFDVNVKPQGDRMQHQHIQLDHGINDQCRNCHNYNNMNELVLYSGQAVSYSEAPRLCQKCHGPTFIDWERGIHGRVSGYWNADLGTPQRLKCIQCHDPHRPRHPAMDPLVPLPGPSTLRMGPQGEGEHGADKPEEADPLRRGSGQTAHDVDAMKNSTTGKGHGE